MDSTTFGGFQGPVAGTPGEAFPWMPWPRKPLSKPGPGTARGMSKGRSGRSRGKSGSKKKGH